MNQEPFWNHLIQLVESSSIIIDRPQGTRHPRLNLTYPLDYGYLSNTSSNDHHEVDLWNGTAINQGVVGIICCVDLFKRDCEMKILIDCHPHEIETILEFHNQTSLMKAILIKKPLSY